MSSMCIVLAVHSCDCGLVLYQPQPRVDLSFHFRQGDEFEYLVEGELMTTLGKPVMQVTVMKNLIESRWVMTSTDREGNGVFKVTIGRVRYSAIEGNKKASFDSLTREKSGPPLMDKSLTQLAQLLEMMPGAVCTIVLSPSVTVKKLKLPDRLKLKEPGLESVMSLLSSKTVQQKLFPIELALPPNPIARGQSWKANLFRFGNVILEQTYSYDGPQTPKGVHRVSFALELDRGADGRFDGRGNAHFDSVRGCIIEGTRSSRIRHAPSNVEMRDRVSVKLLNKEKDSMP